MINNPKSTIVIKTNENVNTFHDTFLTSCFKYFFGKVQFKNDQLKEKQQVKLQLSKSFTQTTAPSTKSIIIIDYPNIMHTLHNEYKNRSLVIQKFYHFVYHALHENNLIYIVSKHVKIGDTTYSVEDVFQEGERITDKVLDRRFLEKENLIIYDLEYTKNISSSIDDLLGWFICVNVYSFLVQHNKVPTTSLNKTDALKKLNLLTNDKQLFQKNLFGLTDQERKTHINIIRDLSVKRLVKNKHDEHYKLQENPFEQTLVRYFLKEYVVANIHDTKDLECNIALLLEYFTLGDNQTQKTKYGYFRRNKWPQYNPNFLKSNSRTRKNNNNKKKTSNRVMSYKKMNEIQKQIFHNKKSRKICRRFDKVISPTTHELSVYYYLYVFIKYVQMQMYTIKQGNKEYADSFGALSVDDIINIFSKTNNINKG